MRAVLCDYNTTWETAVTERVDSEMSSEMNQESRLGSCQTSDGIAGTRRWRNFQQKLQQALTHSDEYRILQSTESHSSDVEDALLKSSGSSVSSDGELSLSEQCR
jgi:hypothetical protein